MQKADVVNFIAFNIISVTMLLLGCRGGGSKIEKVTRGIQGEKSRKDMANSGKLLISYRLFFIQRKLKQSNEKFVGHFIHTYQFTLYYEHTFRSLTITCLTRLQIINQ